MEIYNGTYCVYIHTNKINGKMYVGISSKKPEYRWNHGNGYLQKDKNGNFVQPAIARAIEKYGWDGFDHEVIAANLTREEACNFERLLIDKFDTIKNGYNLTPGGDHFELSELSNKKRSESIRGEKNPFYGKHHSEETKRKISAKLKGRFTGDKNPNYGNHSNAGENNYFYGKHYTGVDSPSARKVAQYTKDGQFIKVWDYMKQAADALHIDPSGITACCRDRQKSAFGFVWRYVD